MSQAKVEQYKKEKANRKKEVARKRMNRRIGQAVGVLIIVAIIVGVGFGVTNIVKHQIEKAEANRPRETYLVNLDDIAEYVSSLDGEEE